MDFLTFMKHHTSKRDTSAYFTLVEVHKVWATENFLDTGEIRQHSVEDEIHSFSQPDVFLQLIDYSLGPSQGNNPFYGPFFRLQSTVFIDDFLPNNAESLPLLQVDYFALSHSVNNYWASAAGTFLPQLYGFL